MASLLELLGADSFRSAAHARAARTIADFPGDLVHLAKTRGKEALVQIEGIGAKLADKIVEFATTGTIAEVAKLQEQVPAGIVPLLKVSGLGPKTVRMLWQEAGVTDLAGLHRVIADGSILALPRMGAKAVEKIRGALAVQADAAERTRLGPAYAIAQAIVTRLRGMKGAAAVEFAGSLRRGRESVGDLDILLATDDAQVMERARQVFCTMPGVVAVLARGETRCTVQMDARFPSRWDPPAPRSEALEAGSADETELDVADVTAAAAEAAAPPKPAAAGGKTIQADLKLVPRGAFGAALLYFTGSKDHNVKLRQRALDRELTLNEYGVFPEDRATKEPPQKRGIAPLAALTEAEVYAALGMAWVPPELREGSGEVEVYSVEEDAAAAGGTLSGSEIGGGGTAKKSSKASSGAKVTASKTGITRVKKNAAAAEAAPPRRLPPDLVSFGDIKCELHAHTTASDGSFSIVELATAAKARGFHTIAVTDHSKSSAIAGGLSPERLRAHMRDVRAARGSVRGINLLAGSEVDILADGRLDYDDDLLAELDIVVASPHAALTQDRGAATARLLRAVAHPAVNILGHPTGRKVMQRPGLDIDLDALCAAAVAHDVALEINAHWMRLDLRDTHVRRAVEAGCLIAIDCDVHREDDFDNLLFGVMTGRRGWLPRARCVNTWSAERLGDWLAQKKARGARASSKS